MNAIANNHIEVLVFLKKELELANSRGFISAFFGAGLKDMIKYIETPEKCGRWPLELLLLTEEAIKKTKKKYLIDFPVIENQTEEDRVLSKLLLKNNYFCFGKNTLFDGIVQLENVVQYMERQPLIYDWTSYFVLRVQATTTKVKEFLL